MCAHPAEGNTHAHTQTHRIVLAHTQDTAASAKSRARSRIHTVKIARVLRTYTHEKKNAHTHTHINYIRTGVICTRNYSECATSNRRRRRFAQPYCVVSGLAASDISLLPNQPTKLSPGLYPPFSCVILQSSVKRTPSSRIRISGARI